MKKLRFTNSELVCRNPKINTFIDSFVFTGENESESNLGQVYIVIETDDSSIEGAEISQGIIEVVKKTYYSEVSLGAEKSFEQTIVKLNEILADLLAAGKKRWLGKLNAVIAVINNKNIALTQTGKAQALLIRGSNTTVITEDLVSQDQTQSPQIFPNLLSGELEPDDTVLLATPTLFSYFSDKQIQQALEPAELSPDKGKQELLKNIKLNSIDQNISAILVVARPDKIKAPKKIKPQATKSKKENPADTREAKTIEPRKHSIDDAVSRRLEARKKKNFFFLLLFLLKQGLMIAGNLSKKGLTLFYRKALPLLIKTVKAIWVGATILVKWLWQKISNLRNKPAKVANPDNLTINNYKQNRLPGKIINIITVSIQKMASLPKPAQATIALGIVGIIMLSVMAGPSTKETTPEINYAELLAKAQEKEKEATTKIIFKDDLTALKLLNEAKEINQQVLGTEDYKEQAKEVQAKIDIGLATLEKRGEPENLGVILDIASLSLNDQADGLILSKQNLFAWNSETNNLFKINLETETGESLSPSFQNIGHLVSGTKADEDGNLIFASDQNNLILYNATENRLEIMPDLPEANTTSLGYYQGKIYSTNRQPMISKYIRTLTGLSKPSEWLTSSSDITNPVSLTIDGFIFVLESDGNIKKFLAGEKQEFINPDLEPALSSDAKIITNRNTNNLYVLDPSNQRILVINKSGEFIKQYTSPEFNDLKDVSISDDATKGYILNGTKVIKFDL